MRSSQHYAARIDTEREAVVEVMQPVESLRREIRLIVDGKCTS
jgi:hypothetical protein